MGMEMCSMSEVTCRTLAMGSLLAGQYDVITWKHKAMIRRKNHILLIKLWSDVKIKPYSSGIYCDMDRGLLVTVINQIKIKKGHLW